MFQFIFHSIKLVQKFKLDIMWEYLSLYSLLADLGMRQCLVPISKRRL